MLLFFFIFQGYSRKGAALAFLDRYAEAEVTYKEGLDHDPNNQQLKDGLGDCQKNLSGNCYYENSIWVNNFCNFLAVPYKVRYCYS